MAGASPATFAGLHVLDFTWVAVGPLITKYLADNGAEVIKLESATHPDVLRMAPPWAEGKFGLNRSQFFAGYNTSKKSLSLDLNHPQARALARRMVAWADVVVENFTPKAMRKWELDYEHLRLLKPDLIMLSSCLQGQTGPNAMMPGFGQLMAALSGFVYISGYPDGEPTPPYGAYTDYVAPRLGAAALIAALDYRRRTGVGQYIDLSQYEASLHFLAPALIDHFATGRVLERRGNRSDRYAPHGAYRGRDEGGEERWLAIAVADDQQWRALLAALGNPPGAERFATMLERMGAAAELDDFIAAAVREREVWELTARLQAGGVAAYPVQNCLDLHHDDNLLGFDFWHWLEHREVGAAPYDGLAYRLERTPGQLRWAAPTLGQDTDQVLREVLGLDDAEIARLRAAGALA